MRNKVPSKPCGWCGCPIFRYEYSVYRCCFCEPTFLCWKLPHAFACPENRRSEVTQVPQPNSRETLILSYLCEVRERSASFLSSYALDSAGLTRSEVVTWIDEPHNWVKLYSYLS